MMEAKKILLSHLKVTAKAGMMALVMSGMLCTSTITISAQAYSWHSNSYFGIAYVADQEARARANKKTDETVNKTITETAKVRAKEKQEKSSFDHERNISFNKEMRTDMER